MGQSVYLAGKIAPSDWRHGVVTGLGDWATGRFEQRFVWPRLENAIFGRFDYVGPYFADFGGHGAAHGDRSHGLRADVAFGADGDEEQGRRELASQQAATALACMDAAGTADVVFAWLDDPTAHGTLVEIGCAWRARTRLIVARPPGTGEPSWGGHGDMYATDDLWFASALPGVEHVRAADPITALRAVLCPTPRVAFESPAEERFWSAWQEMRGPELAVQHRVFGGAYRLDFAHLASRTAIEIDGLAYHNGQEAFQRDRSRDRRLTQAGWRVVRFTAKEVFADARRCAGEAVRLCGSNGSNGRFE